MLGIALAWSCGGERPPPAAEPDSATASAEFPTLPDSLVLTAPGGVSVWYSGARIATDSLGATCVERGLVVLRDDSRTLVPLLMTGAAPVLTNDSTIHARLWRDCRPGATYAVNLRTGTPTRAP